MTTQEQLQLANDIFTAAHTAVWTAVPSEIAEQLTIQAANSIHQEFVSYHSPGIVNTSFTTVRLMPDGHSVYDYYMVIIRSLSQVNTLVKPETTHTDKLMKVVGNDKFVPCDNRIIHKHWSDGGTGLCNFHPKDLAVYSKAIDSFGDPDYIIVLSPLDTKEIGKGFYSLHYLKTTTTTIGYSAFWQEFARVKYNHDH